VHPASWPIPLNNPNIITVSRVDVDIRPHLFRIQRQMLAEDVSARGPGVSIVRRLYSTQSRPNLRMNGRIFVLKLDS
jgi:hypothetical protein